MPPPAPTSTRERAVASDPVQSVHDCSGDQRRGSSGWVVSTVPVGSNRKQVPSCERAPIVASTTSGLVDVEITAPGDAITLGMIKEVVFHDRGGPRTITDCCGAVWHHPYASCPR